MTYNALMILLDGARTDRIRQVPTMRSLIDK